MQTLSESQPETVAADCCFQSNVSLCVCGLGSAAILDSLNCASREWKLARIMRGGC